MEFPGGGLRGEYRDVLRDEHGRVILDTGWQSNMIVRGCRIMLAGFMKQQGCHCKEGEHSELEIGGIRHMRIGQGSPGWDQLPAPPLPDEYQENLVKKAPDEIKIDDQDMAYLSEGEQPTEEPSPLLQITLILGTDYPKQIREGGWYPLREFGLFGVMAGKEYMINCVRHPVINKDNKTTLERVVRLHF